MQKGKGSYHYPSLIQSMDGTLHITDSDFEPVDGKQGRRSGTCDSIRPGLKRAINSECGSVLACLSDFNTQSPSPNKPVNVA